MREEAIITFLDLIKKPSAWVPIAISLTIAGLLFSAGWSGHLQRQPDEGVGAHIFQILMVVQAFLILFFMLRWLSRAPKPGLFVLILQGVALIGAFAPVFLWHL